MTDTQILQWLFDRMVKVHKENENFDYMHRFKAIIERNEVISEITPKLLDSLTNASSRILFMEQYTEGKIDEWPNKKEVKELIEKSTNSLNKSTSKL